jgi:hypothetical protein
MLAPAMIESDKHKLLEDFESGCAALREALAGVGESLAHTKPAPDRWSIVECVEHLAVAERFLQTKLASATRSDTPPDPARGKIFARRLTDRSRHLEAPEPARPQGRFQSFAGALAAFEAARAETIRYVEGFEGDLRTWVTDHPLIPGPVTCYETLLIVATHPLRHARQIAEIRASLDGRSLP